MNQHNDPEPEVLPPEQHQDRAAPALADDVLPDTLVLLPLPGRPFFPGQVQPVSFNPENWQATLDAIAKQGSGLLGLAFVDEPDPGKATTEQFPTTGCVVRLHRPPMAEHGGQFLAQGLRRFRIVRWLNEEEGANADDADALKPSGALSKALPPATALGHVLITSRVGTEACSNWGLCCVT